VKDTRRCKDSFCNEHHTHARSWYSVTPEVVAATIAQRCRGLSVIDAFAGAGGNAIQFALVIDATERDRRVVAVDIDGRRLADARHNAALYGVADRIDFVEGDALEVLARRRADLVFLSPPWGGPGYASHPRGYFDVAADIRVRTTTAPLDDGAAPRREPFEPTEPIETTPRGARVVDGVALARSAARAAPNLAYFLPKTTPADQARRVAEAFLDARRALGGATRVMSDLEPCGVELEAMFLNGRLKAKTLYVGPHFFRPPQQVDSSK